MARNIENRTNVVAPNTDNPYGKVQDVSAPGAGDGTPVDESLLGDTLVSIQGIMDSVGVVPNEQPDDLSNGMQILSAIGEMIYRKSNFVLTKTTEGVDANQWRGVGFGGGRFVAVAGTGTNRAMVSRDNGKSWQSYPVPVATSYEGVAYAEDQDVWVAVGISTAIRSIDGGETWNSATTGPSGNFQAIVYADGLFVAVGINGAISTSPDGDVWTARSSPITTSDLTDITYGNGLYVALGPASNMQPQIISSPDGITWTTQYTPTDDSRLRAIAFANDHFIAMGRETSGPPEIVFVMGNRNAQGWLSFDHPGNGIDRLEFGGGVFVGIRITGASPPGQHTIFISKGGFTWEYVHKELDDTFRGLAYGNGTFVIVGTGIVAYV